MENIFKSWLTIFLLLLLLYAGIGSISANIDAKNAERFVDICSESISKLNFSTEMIENYKNMAKEKGYNISMKEIDADKNGFTDIVEITLEYEYKVPFINLTGATKTIKGYAN